MEDAFNHRRPPAHAWTQHAIVENQVHPGAGRERRQSLQQFDRAEEQVCRAVRPPPEQFQHDLAVAGEPEAVLGNRRALSVATQAVEPVAITGGRNDVRVKIESLEARVAGRAVAVWFPSGWAATSPRRVLRQSVQRHIRWLARQVKDSDDDILRALQSSPVWRVQDNLLRTVSGPVQPAARSPGRAANTTVGRTRVRGHRSVCRTSSPSLVTGGRAVILE